MTPMQMEQSLAVLVESKTIQSEPLGREVKVDFYLPTHVSQPENMSLLMINDGQDLVTMGFDKILSPLYSQKQIRPVFCVGIHCGEDRRNEYGMVVGPDFKGRGAKAGLYQQFIFEELLPFIYSEYKVKSFKERAFAGFSLGGLSALDLVINNPSVFSQAGVFSGSLWWRSKDKDDRDFNENTDRLMHRQVRQMDGKPAIKFFFECGELDETEDRNNNGVIDSIDDTLDLLKELNKKGYLENIDYQYLQLADGKHDVPTWARAWPDFLKWGWRNG